MGDGADDISFSPRSCFVLVFDADHYFQRAAVSDAKSS